MRKLLIIIFLFCCFTVKAQYPDFMPEFKVLNTAADIQLHNAVNGATVLLRGIDTVNDTKGGFFQFNSVSLDAVDGLNVFAVTGIPVGRWLRVQIYLTGSGTVDTIIVNKRFRIPLTDTTHARKGCGNLIYDTILEHYYGDVCLNGVHDHWGCFDCGTGTVTSVATNNGTGITGGTITTTGTLAIDTTIISTKANVDSKTITLTQGSNVTIIGNATQNLGQNPSWTISAITSGGSTNSNIGSGYRWAVPNTNNIKTVFGAYAIVIDSSSNANALTFHVDTSTSGIHTEAYFNTKYVRISDTAAMLSPYLRTAGDLAPLFTTTESSNNIAFSQQNTTQYTVLGRIASGSGAYSFVTADSTLIQDLHSENYYNTKYIYTASNGITLTAKNFTWGGTLAANTTITGAGFYSAFSGGRLEAGQGAAVTAANDLTLGGDGNTFSISGATQINAIIVANWQAGSVVNLIFASTPLVKNNTAGGAGTAPILLASSADFQAAANDVLTLVYDGSNWHETSRKQATAGGQFWALANGGTLTGVNTITSSRNAGLNFTGTYTSTNPSGYFIRFNPAITGSSTASDTLFAMALRPNLTQGANSQPKVAFDLNPINSNGGFTGGTSIAMRFNGNMIPYGGTWSLGTLGTSDIMNSVVTTNLYADFQRSLTTSSNITWGSSNLSLMRLFDANSAAPGLQITTHGNLSATSNGYMLESQGGSKTFGSAVISTIAAPGAPTLTTSGTAGTTSITYKIVAKFTSGATTEAGSSTAIATANATLTGSNRVNISWAEVVGAASYDVYVTATTGAATLGKIGSYTTQANSQPALTHTSNAQGDGTTPPSVNTTGSLGVGTTSPTSMTQILGSFSLSYIGKTASYTATALDQTINFTSGTDTLTLPTAVGITGRIYTVVNSGANTCKINTTSSQTFVNINTAPTILTLNPVGAAAITCYSVMSNGANWIVIGKVKDE